MANLTWHCFLYLETIRWDAPQHINGHGLPLQESSIRKKLDGAGLLEQLAGHPLQPIPTFYPYSGLSRYGVSTAPSAPKIFLGLWLISLSVLLFASLRYIEI